MTLPFDGSRNVAWAQASLAPGSNARIDVGPGGRVNVRAEPSTDTAIVGRASRDDLVLIVESAEQGLFVWHKVISVDGAIEGWIRGDLLTGVAAPAVDDEIGPSSAENEDDQSVSEPAQLSIATPPDELEPQRRSRTGDGWTAQIVGNLDAIDGCASISSAPPIKVLDVSLRNPSIVSVIFLDSAGRSWDCLIMPRGRTPIQFGPAGSAYRLISRRAGPTFIRAPEPPPEGDCIEIEEVKDESRGVVVGHLIYEVC